MKSKKIVVVVISGASLIKIIDWVGTWKSGRTLVWRLGRLFTWASSTWLVWLTGKNNYYQGEYYELRRSSAGWAQEQEQSTVITACLWMNHHK